MDDSEDEIMEAARDACQREQQSCGEGSQHVHQKLSVVRF